MNPLLKPLDLGGLPLHNRIVMAPLTRCRADAGHTPGALMKEYYAQRASAGLIIAEATMVIEGTSAFSTEPGIYSQEQVKGWQAVTDAVHAKGGRMFLQLWHGGRACHPLLNDGKEAVAPSAMRIRNDEVHTPEGKQPYTIPRALSLDEIALIVEGFRQAAVNAKEAGFDGVEVHGANGYLIDEFLRDGSNHRTDSYGGPVENRARLLFEVLEAVCSVWESHHVGLRLSPLNSYNDMQESHPVELYSWLAEELNRFELGYLHVMRADFFDLQHGDVLTPIREVYNGILIANMGYTSEEAAKVIKAKEVDAVAFGTSFLANPDLVERIKVSAPLNEADPDTFYSPGPKGYTDYPFLSANE